MGSLLGNTRPNGHSSIENCFKEAYGKSERGRVGKESKKLNFFVPGPNAFHTTFRFSSWANKATWLFLRRDTAWAGTRKVRAQIGRLPADVDPTYADGNVGDI